MSDEWLEQIQWTADGLAPAIAQDAASGRVLMLAWMSRESLRRTVECGEAVYWSRSRQQLWHKGETSGNIQKVRSIRLDCDHDVLLLDIDQIGGVACHTGRQSCFFEELREGEWTITDPILKDPHEMYPQ
jgi:phosphoribosyl-AMP cyclohydrolase